MTQNSATILVVDDDDSMRETLVEDLQGQGYQILSANSGKAALELIQSQKVDLVISDVLMPGMDGVELLDLIKKRGMQSPPVILISGYSRVTADEILKRGAVALLPKPFKRAALIQLINQQLAAKASGNRP